MYLFLPIPLELIIILSLLALIIVLSGVEQSQFSTRAKQYSQPDVGNNNNIYNNLNLNARNSNSNNFPVSISSSATFFQRGYNSPATENTEIPRNYFKNYSDSSTKNIYNKSLEFFSSSNDEKKYSKHTAALKDFAESTSTQSLEILAYENSPNNYVNNDEYNYVNNDEKKSTSMGCIDRFWHGIKTAFLGPEQAIPSLEVEQYQTPRSLVDVADQRVLRSAGLNTEYLPTLAIPYIKNLIDYFRKGTYWKAITQHFLPGQWLGEDDLTNLMRLAGATHQFSQKFAWVTVDAMSMNLANFNYRHTLENYVEKTNEIVFIPCCNGGHFTVWVYDRIKNNLQYYDPQNYDPSELLQQKVKKVIKILFNPQILPSTSNTLVKIPVTMKQQDQYNCGIITFDIILRLMETSPRLRGKYDPNVNRKKYFMLFKDVYESNIIKHSYFYNTSKITPIPPFSSPSTDDNDDNFIPEIFNESNPKIKDYKNYHQVNKPFFTVLPLKIYFALGGNKKKYEDFIPTQPSKLLKVDKIKRLKIVTPENSEKSEFHTVIIKKRYSKRDAKKEAIKNKLGEARKEKVNKIIDEEKEYMNEYDFDFDENLGGMDSTEESSSQLHEKSEPDLIVTGLRARVRSSTPKLTYTPRISNKLPNSFWRSKKRLESQIEGFFPGYFADIILRPKDQKPQKSSEKFIELKVGAKLKKDQVEKLTKILKTPSYPTTMKNIKAKVPYIPDVAAVNIPGRSNLIFKDFYSFVVARIQNTDKLPEKGPIRVNSQADTGDGRTLFTFNFVDVENPNSPSSHACFAMFDGSDKRKNIIDITENINAGAEKLQREGVILNGTRREVVCFLNGDLKIQCEFCGCQGGSAKKFCCKCKTQDDKTLGDLRTLEEIAQNYNDFEAEYLSGKQNAHRNGILKQKYNSVNGKPLIPNIPLTRVVPPSLHILMALVNKFLFFIMCTEYEYSYKQKIMECLF